MGGVWVAAPAGNLAMAGAMPAETLRSPQPCCLQVTDFGVSRLTHAVTHTESYGTITHMPPELLRDGTLTSATDVW